METKSFSTRYKGWRSVLFEVIFEADTPAGKIFDVGLMISIVLSVIVVVCDSVGEARMLFGGFFYAAEWFFTLLFSIEYGLRLICVGKPIRYALSFFGLVDLMSILPTYVSLMLPGSHYLLVIRVLRVLRVFRVLKLAQYTGEASRLAAALWNSRRKIFVFLIAVLTLVVIIGAVMYLIEGERNGFTSIPRGIYWTIVTLTTVGYGDISPQTNIGQLVAAIVMILGYAIIAVPTGIVTAEMVHHTQPGVSTQVCPQCSAEGHDHDAVHCKYCGEKL